MINQAMHIKAVFFHLESTLVRPTKLDMARIKVSIGCPAEITTLDFLQSLSKAEDRSRAQSSLDRLELEAAADSKSAPGAAEMLRYLELKNLRLAVFSHGSPAFVDQLLKNLSSVRVLNFNPIISRVELMATIPASNAVDLATQKLKLAPNQVLVVTADSIILQQAQSAGAVTVFFDPAATPGMAKAKGAYQISKLDQLKQIVRRGTPLPAGKLPNDLLREFLNQFDFHDPSILINPGVGEDTAAVDVESEEVLVLKSDPITFATDAIGQYVVLINANDIATSGAKPRWLLTTLLFPCGVTPSEIHKVIEELKEFCRRWEITLCGGHTEITDAVTRPVVTGMMAGTVARRNLIDKRNMAPGDRVLLTKGVSVEGTAIIAREFGDRLAELGLADSEIERCRQFLANISIITEAQMAAQSSATSAMHDVTEGGLATALEELSIAGGHRIKIDMDAIPVFAETRKICRLLGIQPLGLIGSGSLLICCREAGCQSLMEIIRKSGIKVSRIGEVLDSGQGISAVKKGQSTDWPQFEVDEITRLF
jgi:hydrogenase maturation factor/beta-phosphoglucomutase-like phosphatase (HAD superfamily)